VPLLWDIRMWQVLLEPPLPWVSGARRVLLELRLYHCYLPALSVCLLHQAV
jgi:hypothetical protein